MIKFQLSSLGSQTYWQSPHPRQQGYVTTQILPDPEPANVTQMYSVTRLTLKLADVIYQPD